MINAKLSHLLKNKSQTMFSISRSDNCLTAAQMMNEKDVGSLLIMENNEFFGLATERDFLKKLVGKHLDPQATPITEIMTPKKKIISVSPDNTILEAMQTMNKNRIHHLPISEKKNIIGIISAGDLTKWIIDSQESEISSLTDYISGG